MPRFAKKSTQHCWYYFLQLFFASDKQDRYRYLTVVRVST